MNKTNQRTNAPRCNVKKKKTELIPALFSYREN